MDIGLLKTFIEVNRTRHFGQAAENLFLTQSAVSARIRLLEETVGVPLFTRTRNNIDLTPAGQKLLRYADSILVTWNRARQDIAIEDSEQVPFAIGGVPSLWDILLQDWINNISKNDPNLSIHAEVHASEVLVKRLLDHTLDVAFLFESLQMTELAVEQVGNVKLIMVTSIEGLAADEAVTKPNYILVNWGTSFAIEHAKRFPDMPPPRMRFDLGRLAHSYLLNCGGTAYLAESMVAADLESKKLFVVSDAPEIKRMCYAAYLPGSDRLDVVQRAIQPIVTDNKLA